MGTVLIIGGVALVAVGVVIEFAPWLVNWFGRLPGDIRIERETTRVYVPITSMLVVSVAVTLLVGVVTRMRG